jgi:SAM-dependent methyltransferase
LSRKIEEELVPNKGTEYQEYVADQPFMDSYIEYQHRYEREPRESDKIIIRHVRAAIQEKHAPVVLDIGCSTGNLLRHLKREVADVTLVGGELADEALETCRKDPALEGVNFEHLDALDLPSESFDVVVANAVLCLFNPTDFVTALASIYRSLRPGGTLISFDWLHPFRQELAIQEVSRSHKQGMWLYFRSFGLVEAELRNAGFSNISFEPFSIPIDLEKGSKYGDNSTGFEDLNSYTVRSTESERLIFRGALYTPWCHLLARKK